MYKYHKVFNFLKKTLNKKKILNVYASFKFPALKKDNFRYKKEHGGFFWDSAVYPISLDTFLFKKVNNKNIAVSNFYKNSCSIHGNIIQKNKGFQKIYKWGSNQKYENHIELICKDCTIFINKFFTKFSKEKIYLQIFSQKQNKVFIFKDDQFKNMFLNVFKNYKKKLFKLNSLKEINEQFDNVHKIFTLNSK